MPTRNLFICYLPLGGLNAGDPVAVETVAALRPGVAVVVEKGLFFAPPSPASSAASKRSTTPPSDCDAVTAASPETGAEEGGGGGGAGSGNPSTAPLVQGDRIVSVDGVLVVPENMDDLANVSKAEE